MPPSLTATIYHRGQILGRHTFANWLRIVHHLSRRQNNPTAVLSGASGVVETSVDSEESRGVLLSPFCWHSATHI